MKFLLNRIKRINNTTFLFNCNKFHTSHKQDAIAPILWVIIKPISKLSSILIGRSIRKIINSPNNLHKKEALVNHFKLRKKLYLFGISSLGIGCYANYLSHIEETPITHRKRFILFNTEHFLEIEDIEKKDMLNLYKDKILPISNEKTQRTYQVAKRLFMANKTMPEVKDIDWKLTVIDADLVNAHAFPSGEVFVYSGLLDFVDNDDELAFVIAHEMAHAILQHTAETMSQLRLLDIFSIGLSFLFWGFLPADWSAILMESLSNQFHKYYYELPYSRKLEKEADLVGMQLAARACFDIRYSPQFWTKMKISSKEEIPEFLSTHPSNDTRALDLESLVPEALKIRQDCKCYELPKTIKQSKIILSN
ncbi:unnamed protein product [Brachionus calyciflorus]|uniref:Metalloendopeptidase OMA1, mitochondrial n=1 Tax=Brachionus calyciflorus TaxID=104777 RepID=A0A814CYZ6_9BILA|nr:unnamed protein product [Brachionus calyciflorus]